jgi:hypothetical protein
MRQSSDGASARAAGWPGDPVERHGTDEHGRLYQIDRWGPGMHIVEYTG